MSVQLVQSWTGWLRDTLIRWTLRGQAVAEGHESPDLVQDIQAPRLPISAAPDLEVDLTVELVCSLDDGTWDRPSPVRAARALATQLIRQSDGDVLSSPDAWMPTELIAALCERSLGRATRHLEEAASDQAERFLALAVAIAGGLREIDLPFLRWGAEPDASYYVVAIDLPVLYRPLRRPPNAVDPPTELRECLKPVTEYIAWPLPDSVHRKLVELAMPSGAVSGVPVFAGLADPCGMPYRLRDLIAELQPAVMSGYLPIRFAMAADIARRFGPEVAQLALGDTFTMTAAPAYYTAVPESELAEHVATIQRRWFGEVPTLLSGRECLVGSRLVLTDSAAQMWAACQNKAKRAVAHEGREAQWRAHRIRLAAALCSVTGHRPEDGLGKIRLYDVIPSCGLIILQDKQVDVRRSTRIAATGRRWLADLRSYLDRLAGIAECAPESAAGRLAYDVLRGQATLFSAPLPGGEISIMDAAQLRASMPETLQPVPNFYRHYLNQYLQQREVDPELRHAQLGWVVSNAHATADLSPLSPKTLGALLGPILDDLVKEQGWYGSSQRLGWGWERVPMPPLKDWKAVFAQARKQHDEDVRELAERLRELGREVEKVVLPRVAAAIEELIPALRIDADRRRLELATSSPPSRRVVVQFTQNHHALICDRIAQQGDAATRVIESAVTRLLLYRLIRSARDRGIVEGPIPSRPYLRLKAEPSPFPVGLGLAVRQADAMREVFLARARQQKVRDQAYLAIVAMLAYSPYRTISGATEAVGDVSNLLRGHGGHGLIRLPGNTEHGGASIAVGGIPALLLSKRSIGTTTARAPGPQQLGEWIGFNLPCGFQWSQGVLAADALADVFWAAAAVELSGIERSILRRGGLTATASRERCVAFEDRWPARTGIGDVKGAVQSAVPRIEESPSGDGNVQSARCAREDYRRLTALLNPHVFRKMRAEKAAAQDAEASDGKRNWRKALAHELRQLREKVGTRSNLGVLVNYSLDHLLRGSEAGGKLAHASLHREITRFSGALLDTLDGQLLLELDAEAISRIYLTVIAGKPPQARPHTFEELRRFHHYLIRAYGIPDVELADHEALAGARTTSARSGLLTEAEIALVVRQLRDDLDSEVHDSEASPEARRICERRLLLFLVLESSGIRPGSAYGLVHADVHLLAEGRDFVHVRTTGDYGEAKTVTAVGYVPLTGALWRKHREWVRQCVEREREDAQGLGTPLFARAPGHRRRLALDMLTRRIDELLKWASGQSDASTYWLRKNRVTKRHRALMQMPRPFARDVRDVLCACGHADIAIPLLHYINDPAAVLHAHLADVRETPRSEILAVTGLSPPPLDMAWSRAPDLRDGKVPVVLERMRVPFAPSHQEALTVAPALRSRERLMPHHIASYARGMSRKRNRQEASACSGLTDAQARALDRAASELLLLSGQSPWLLDGLRHPRAVMAPPRAMAGTEALFDLLKSQPGEDLSLVAETWARQGQLRRLHESGVLMRLCSPRERSAAEHLVDTTRVGLEVVDAEDVSVLRIREQRQSGKGHGAAFRWVLAIIWIYSKAIECSQAGAA
ncbi:hypothetical protein GCM10009105_37640 [Dokdonella soli]|uniref:Tyr recombinase domain-containing protein n=2 Tax=Dokdonella soli TaxID=529810 RepID=A0ABP3U9S1_9GAMM